jgi:YD repeat-containing protein
MNASESRVKTSTAARHGNRNLFLFALLVAVALTSVVRYRRRSQLAAATKLALSALHGTAAAPTLDGTHPCMLTVLSSGEEKPVLTRCATPTTHKGGMDQFEVDLRYGAFEVRQTDLEVKDVFDVPLTRTYTAQDWAGVNHVHAFGRNSNHTYDIAPLGTRNPYTEMDLTLEDSDFLHFKRISPGTGYANAVYQHTETPTRFYKSTINWNGNGWTLRLTGGEEMFFPESYAAKNLAQGAVTEIRDTEGNKLELQRDRKRNLLEILTPHGHWIKFIYDDQARITRAEDDAKNWANYTYSDYGMLTDVIWSSGRARHYEYQGSRMTAILDGQDHVLVRNTFHGRVLTAQVYPNGDIYNYQYVWSANRKYAVKVTITMPDGGEREVHPTDSVSVVIRK